MNVISSWYQVCEEKWFPSNKVKEINEAAAFVGSPLESDADLLVTQNTKLYQEILSVQV